MRWVFVKPKANKRIIFKIFFNMIRVVIDAVIADDTNLALAVALFSYDIISDFPLSIEGFSESV